MTPNYLSLALMVSALALAACAKNQSDSQNPDGTGGNVDGSADGQDGSAGGDEAAGPSRARTSTAPRGKDRATKARRVTANKPPRAPDDEDGGEDQGVEGPHGLLVEAFVLDSATALPDFASLGAPIQTFAVPNLDYDEAKASAGFPGLTKLTQNYALRFTGSINIVEEAEYELCLHSDDGSQLLLEDTLIVDNDGVHESAVEACELVYLAPGEYQLAIHYFQGAGPLMTMHFAWSINGGDKAIVPSAVLYKPASAAG
jgi:hypothetical protein